MEQIICIHIGQAGIQIGIELWKLFMREHGLDYNGFVQNDTYGYVESVFSENSDGRYSPRALF